MVRPGRGEVMDTMTKARLAREAIREQEASLVHLVCPKCGQWCDAPPQTKATCLPCGRVMKKEGAN